MSEKILKLFQWLAKAPLWKRILLPLLAAGFVAVLVSSCGTSKAVANIRNNADGTTTSVNISGTAGGNVSIQASPEVRVDFDFSKTPKDVLKDAKRVYRGYVPSSKTVVIDSLPASVREYLKSQIK